MAPSGDHSLAAAASSTRRGVHELTPDLLFGFLFTERDGRVPRYRARPVAVSSASPAGYD